MLVVNDEAFERVHAALPQPLAVQHLLVLVDRRRQILELLLVDIGELDTSRARCRRDFTVPSGNPVITQISSIEY